MKINNNTLNVFVGSSNFSDVAWQGTEQFSFSHTNANKLMIGYHKPIRQIYIDIKTPNNFASKITAEYYNGSAWVELKIIDETLGYKKSGFIIFDDAVSNSQASSHESISAHWVRFSVSINTSPITSRFINLVFCSEYDLKKIRNDITSFYPEDDNSFILSLIQARDEILLTINNSGLNVYKYKNSEVKFDVFNAFDLFNLDTIRVGASYLTSKIIMSQLSHLNTTDNYDELTISYDKQYQKLFEAFKGLYLSMDLDGDGIESDYEKEVGITELRLIPR